MTQVLAVETPSDNLFSSVRQMCATLPCYDDASLCAA